MSLRRASLALVFSSLCGAAATAQGFVEPFEGGLRWTHAASLGEPWIPTRVAFAAGAELVWAGTGGANRRLLVIDAPQGGVVQPCLSGELSGQDNVLDVEARAGASRLYSLTQQPDPDPFHRRSLLSRRDVLEVSRGASFDPRWSFACDFVANGPACMAVDEFGAQLALAVWKDAPAGVRVHRVDGESGALLDQVDLPAASLESLAISGDGRVIAVGLGRGVTVLDEAGSVLPLLPPAGQAFELALDGDGSRLVVGSPQELRVYDFDGASFALTQTHTGGPDEAPLRVALSSDGEAYAGAWYRYTQNDRLLCRLYDGTDHQVVAGYEQLGAPGGLQNSPAGLELSADGRRVAFASWGRGDDAPEVVLLERGVAEPLLEVDLPGSALAIDLAPDGEAVAVAAKNLHANQIGTTGEVRLYRTGEADLEQLAPARLGGSLELASRHPGASVSLFLVGNRAAQPALLFGAELHLVRDARLRVFARAADAEGRAALSLPLSAHPSVAGAAFAAQAAHRVSGSIELGSSVLEPLVH